MGVAVVTIAVLIGAGASLGNHRWGPTVQQVTSPFEHAEGPTWDDASQLLYFVDIHRGLVNSLDPSSLEVNSVRLEGSVSPVVPTRRRNRFTVGLNKTVVLLTWDGRNSTTASVRPLATVSAGERFNDGKADELGRLWWGTIGYRNASVVVPGQAAFYRIDTADLDNPRVQLAPVTNSNGLTWSRDNKKLFYIDTPTRKIARFDFNLNEGTISNKTIVFDLEKNGVGGLPDGMTIDENDHLFIALYNGGSVIKVDPESGALLQTIAIPARQVTSVMFGGKEYEFLFVTTSRYGLSQEERSQQPAAGSVFAVANLRTKGRRTFSSEF